MMKQRELSLIFVLFIFLIGAVYAQDSLNISLISRYDWPVDSTWIFDLELNGDYLYAFGDDMNDRFRIIDVSNPLNPSFVGTVHCFFEVYETTIVNQTLFVLTSYELVIFDVSVPESPVLLSRTFFDGGMSEPYLLVTGNYVYIGNYDEIKVIDISNLESPEIVVFSMIIGITNIIDIIEHDNILFLASYRDSGIVLFDISNPESPDSLDYILRNMIVHNNMISNENVLYVNNFNYLSCYDISTPTAPDTLGSFALPGFNSIGGQMLLKDNYLFIGYGTVTVLDISDPENLEVIGYNRNYGYSAKYQYNNGILYTAEDSRIGIYDCTEFDATSEPDQDKQSLSCSLKSIYPNPFNSTVTAVIVLPERSRLNVRIYNLLGEQVAVLADNFFNTGYHKLKFDASGLPSGIYFVQATVLGKMSELRKVVLVR